MDSGALVLSPESCDAVIAEAAAQVKPTLTATTSCNGMKVRPGSAAAAALAELGLESVDAQVVRYGPGGEYVWHTDGPGRELSVMVQLSDPADYEGGRVEVEDWPDPPTERGTASEWPAQIPHRTTPVTEGERWALVAWRDGG